MDDTFNVGDIVLSRMGRDSGRHYIIMSAEENYVYICDGDFHKVDKPKKKKLKHIKATNTELRRAVLEFEETNAQA